jgi:hypothetical protein
MSCIAVIIVSKVTVSFFAPQLTYMESVALAIGSRFISNKQF